MGYMIAPEHLVDTFRTGIAELYREGQLMQQAVMTDFIMDGYLTSHVRRMRALYGERRQILIDAITARFGIRTAVMGDEAGLHLVLGLPDHADDRAVDGRRVRRRRDRARRSRATTADHASRGRDCCSAMRACRTNRSARRSTRSRA